MSEYTWPEETNLTIKKAVGIGITNPSEKLEVNGTIAATNLNVTNTVKAAKFEGDGSMLTGISRWSLAYAHDQNGTRTAGDINSLINFVQIGYCVRVLMDSDNVQYVINAEHLYIRNGIVYAQNTSQVSSGFDGDILKFQDDSYYWMVSVSTKGDRDMIRWNVGEHVPRGHTQDRVAMKWFVG